MVYKLLGGGILRFFALQGQHSALIGVKFGMDEYPKVHSSMPYFSPHWCGGGGTGSPKLKILLKFYQISEYKHPTGAYLLHDFYHICSLCSAFQDVIAIKVWMDLLNWLWSYGVFS